jgi:curved DNA-binding protein CbpA
MTVDGTDPYAVLGLTPNATQGQIRHAYRTLVRQHHPDTRPSTDPDHDHDPDRDPERDAAQDATLRRVVAAYAVLRERRRRADDDQQPGPAPTAPIPVRRVTFARRSAPEPPPVQVGPVRWHGLRR